VSTHADPRFGLGVGAHLGTEPVDRCLQRVDQPQAVLDHLPGRRGQIEPGQPVAARAAPAAPGPVLPVVGEHRLDPVAQQRPQLDQLNPVPQQHAELAHRRRSDPRLRQQIRAQQLGQDVRVDLVVGQPGRGDRLAPRRVRQVRLEPVVLEQLDQPAPAERGLERRRRADRHISDRPQDRFHPVRHVPLASTSPA
jgi:hypothetical protein